MTDINDTTTEDEIFCLSSKKSAVFKALIEALKEIFRDVGKKFEIINTYPSFSQDWRWFKSLHGQAKNFNDTFESEYYRWCHGFISYEMSVESGSVDGNKILESKCLEFIDMVKIFETNINKKLK
jgi:hypothetical protein